MMKIEVVAFENQITAQIAILITRSYLKDRISQAQDKDPFLEKKNNNNKRIEVMLMIVQNPTNT